MAYIIQKEENITHWVCTHPAIDKVWFTSSLGPFDDPSQISIQANLRFKDKTRISFASSTSLEECIGMVERYLNNISLENDTKLTAANYWKKRCQAAEEHIKSREMIPLGAREQEITYEKWKMIIDLRQMIKPFS